MRNKAFRMIAPKTAQELKSYEEFAVQRQMELRQLKVKGLFMQQRKSSYDELSTQKKRENPSTVNQLVVQILDFKKGEFFQRRKRCFHDPETASSSGVSHVPSQPMRFPSLRRMLSRESCLSPDTRNSFGTAGNVLERKSICSRCAILSTLREFKEFGISFSERKKARASTLSSGLCDSESLLSYWRNLFRKLYVEKSETHFVISSLCRLSVLGRPTSRLNYALTQNVLQSQYGSKK